MLQTCLNNHTVPSFCTADDADMACHSVQLWESINMRKYVISADAHMLLDILYPGCTMTILHCMANATSTMCGSCPCLPLLGLWPGCWALCSSL